MRDWWREIRFAIRSFRRTPGFTIAAVSVLGIGIGAVTLMFGTLHAVVLQPLPFADPDRLVWAWLSSNEQPNNSISAADYFDYSEQADTFGSLAVFLVFRPPVVITGEEQQAQRRHDQGVEKDRNYRRNFFHILVLKLLSQPGHR